MKVFFGINITKDKKNETYDGEVFIGKKLPQDQARAMEAQNARMEDCEEKAKLPLALRVVQLVAFFVAVCAFLGVIKADVSIFQAYRNAPWVFYGGIAAAVIWAVLFLLEKLRERKQNRSEENAVALHRQESLEWSCYEALDVPGDAPYVDVLLMRYKEKKGKPVPVATGGTTFLNPQLRIFIREGKLCLADLFQRYDIPMKDLAGIYRVNAWGSAPSWNKDESFPNDKGYKITTFQYGIRFKPYYALFIRRQGETYALYFPPYELPLFQKLTGCVML
ncbi:MAG: hypothetical protein ACI3V3_01875 [Faecousia sp.]